MLVGKRELRECVRENHLSIGQGGKQPKIMGVFTELRGMDDDDFMQEDEDYGFEYESDDGEEPDVDLENSYYNAKGMLCCVVCSFG